MKKIYLLVSAIGLSVIALSYGIAPSFFLPQVFGISTENINLLHIMRAVMCLYWGMSVFWVFGTLKEKYREAAIVSDIFFMSGLVIGRVISIIIDGIPHWLLLIYLGLEIFMAISGYLLLKIK